LRSIDDVALDDIPVVDNHCHAPLRAAPTLDALGFRRCFTESRELAVHRDHVPHALFYRQALRELAAFLGCPPTEEAVLASRASIPPPAYLARLLADGGVRGLLVDFGYQSGESLEPAELAELAAAAGCRVWPVLRLETLAEELLPRCADLGELAERFQAAVRAAPEQGIVALKTIIAYRSGLDVAPPSPADAATAFEAIRRQGEARPRLTAKPLLDYLLWLALAEAATLRLPVQIHCGFGDTDLDLRRANPLHLRPILEEPAFAGTPLVLLHCHPFVAEAAYLASVYAQVSLDLSLTVPFLGASTPRAFAEALALAPASKLLYGSDGFSIPELYWLGARWGRRALARALGEWRSWGLPAADCRDAAERILHRNAEGLYRL
jgi:hypothetical protein